MRWPLSFLIDGLVVKGPEWNEGDWDSTIGTRLCRKTAAHSLRSTPAVAEAYSRRRMPWHLSQDTNTTSL